jgi:flagellar biosynthesis protein FlhB
LSHHSGEERTIEPSPRRLAEARRRGLFAHSRELTAAAFGVASVGALWVLGPRLWNATIAQFSRSWAEPATSIADVWPDGPIGGPGRGAFG